MHDCHWEMLSEIWLHKLLDVEPTANYYYEAFTYLDHEATFALVQVISAIEKANPFFTTCLEDGGPVNINPYMNLNVKEEFKSNTQQSHDHIYLLYANVTISEGFLPESDVLFVPEMFGIESIWDKTNGVLTLLPREKINGSDYYFDLSDDAPLVGNVDITRLLIEVENAMTVDGLSNALKNVYFETTDLGQGARTVSLTIVESLMVESAAIISYIEVQNNPDDPKLYTSSVIRRYEEKSDFTSVDPSAKVRLKSKSIAVVIVRLSIYYGVCYEK